LNIEGIQYDSLFLAGETVNEQVVKIRGKSTDQKKWFFTIPDSAYDSVPFFAVFPKAIKKDSTIVQRISFVSYLDGDTIKFGDIPIDRKITVINAQYIGTKIYEHRLINRIGQSNTEENLFYANLHADRLFIPCYENSDYVMQGKYSYISNFNNQDNIEMSYTDYISQYKNIISQYPDSRYLIMKIAIGLQSYETKESLQEIFDCFSNTNKQTNWGKMIHNYIENYYTFSNTVLPTWDTNAMESIIRDTTKLNLIVFSASWCSPCHKQIPILKEIYNDLKDNIEITYISLDEPKYVEKWKELMIKESIPWRSLLAVNDVKAIQKKYNAKAIPYGLLVYPSGRLETLDVRDSIAKEKLYRLAK
jgi:thiol-disulfide isomerase/thioredoxin